jgi:transcriptional regulator with XRE-family HTH domain
MNDDMNTRREQPPVEPGMARIGALLRAARETSYTVQELSERSGVSAGLISQLERGRGNPSYQTLYRLAAALGVRLGDLVQAGEPSRDPAQLVVRAGARKRLQVGDGGLIHELLTPNLRGTLEMLRTEVPAGFSNADAPFRHPGEECVHVLSGGPLEVSVGGELYTLAEGDSITYNPGVAHWWRNPTEAPAVVIGAVTPPSF